MKEAYDIPMTSQQWSVPYNGFGYVSFDGANGAVLSPHAATDPGETHAALALAKRTEANPVRDFRATIVVSTEAQLRAKNPNAWECFWLFFNYSVDPATGNKKTNYFIFKPSGLELGTAQAEIAQDFLWTKSSPTLEIGKLNTITVTKIGARVEASIDGALVMSHSDGGLFDVPGSLGLYTEDARVRVKSVRVEVF